MNSATKLLYSILFLGIACVVSSCAVADGPFEQVSGHPIDAHILQDLKRRKASISNVVEILGPPLDQRTSGRNTVLVYKSTRARTSHENVADVTISESTQKFMENWELEFLDGALIQTRVTSQVVERR